MDARRPALGLAWLVVGATYVVGGIGIAAARWWGTLGLAALLLLLVALTLRVESRSAHTNARRWRLCWGLGAFHVASCALVGATSGFGYSGFVSLAFGSDAFRAAAIVGRLVILVGGVLLAGAALRPRDLDGRDVQSVLALRAIPAGAAMGLVVAAAAGLFVPYYALTLAAPTGIVWALGYWVFDTLAASIVRA